MKDKGFTLIELLGVIALLAILAFIAVPAVSKSIANSRERAYNLQVSNIISSAKNWVADHPYSIPEESGDSVFVSLGELRTFGYADMKIINPKTEKNISNESTVEIRNVNGGYEYFVNVIDE